MRRYFGAITAITPSGLTARLAAVGLAAILGTAAGGCSSSPSSASTKSKGFRPPPAAATADGPAVHVSTGRHLVVLGAFRDPPHTPVPWTNIGQGMSEALAGTLLNHADLDVWIDPPLVRRVGAILDLPQEQRRGELLKIQKEFPAVKIVIAGAVTDFTHTSELHREVRRRGLFGRKNEAVVAIKLFIVDLELGRVVATDHVHGLADASRTPPEKLYANMAFGSYVFWSSPLGGASRLAIQQSMEVLDGAIPSLDSTIRIVEQTGPRSVRILTQATDEVEPGEVLFICRADETSGWLEAVRDPDTRLELTAKIETVKGKTATAWLTGKKPTRIDLRNTVLLRRLPAVGGLTSASPEAEAPGDG